MISGVSSNQQSMFQQSKQSLIKSRYNEIYAHEMKHKMAGGSFAGNIVIERDQNGIPNGGHVNIKMPTLNKENPEETIKHADVVIKSAMAPSDPSAQDYKVAAEARNIKAKAKSEENKPQAGSKLNFYA